MSPEKSIWAYVNHFIMSNISYLCKYAHRLFMLIFNVNCALIVLWLMY